MVASASAQIEASGYIPPDDWILLTRLVHFIAAGEHSRTTIQGPDGPEDVPNYALIQGIFIGCVAAYIIILAFIGPENHGSHFEKSKTAFQVGASKEDVSSIPAETEEVQDVGTSSMEGEGVKEKGGIQQIENKRPAKDNLV